MTLREAGQAAGGMDCTAVAMRIKRMKELARSDTGMWKMMNTIEAERCEDSTPGLQEIGGWPNLLRASPI